MKGISEMYQELEKLGEIIASHATTEGRENQIVKIDVTLLRESPFFASANKNN